jgi:hypothetical protein
MSIKIKLLTLFFTIFLTTIIFNNFAQEIIDLNTKLRVLLKYKTLEDKSFDQNGIPTFINSRVGSYTSPFYVVHYGLQYSRECLFKIQDNKRNKFHWKDDPTNIAWHQSPLKPSLDLFKSSSEWVLKNIKKDEYSNSHLYYKFNWPYPNLIGGKLTAPWWSGLTDGHAITLMLRAYDCFGDHEYLIAAANLYSSTITPFHSGGSLVFLNGYPWIEEYADPAIPEESLSRVFNGMAYAYFGIRSYEEYFDFIYYSDQLKNSIIANINIFSKGNWSYYDSIKTSANLKYHRVNLELLRDERLYSKEFDLLIKQWTIGSRFPFFYFIFSENSISKYQFYLSFAIFLCLLNYIFIYLFQIFIQKK